MSVVVGIIGTGFGGWLLDYIRKRYNITSDEASTHIALLLITVLTALALPCGILAFSFNNFSVFFGCLALTEFFVFAALPPTNSILLWVVPINLRPMAMGFSVYSFLDTIYLLLGFRMSLFRRCYLTFNLRCFRRFITRLEYDYVIRFCMGWLECYIFLYCL